MAAKLPEEHRDIHREADKREPALERAVRRGAGEMADGINLDALELAIGTGDVAKVMALFPPELLEAGVEDLAELISEAWLEGNLIGADDINEVLADE